VLSFTYATCLVGHFRIAEVTCAPEAPAAGKARALCSVPSAAGLASRALKH
jgi:hypothetical protein